MTNSDFNYLKVQCFLLKKTESTFYKTLGYIGLNKILVFGKDSEGNFEVLIGGREMALVMTKVILYLFMSLQLLIYSSRNFIEYYFIFTPGIP